MRTIIHDLSENEIIKFDFNKEDKIIDSNKCTNTCVGCFSCWIKHPKRCIYSDEYSNVVESIKNSDELILISKCRYGCYSSIVKRVLERCIGYVLPYFIQREGSMHHESRYENDLKLCTYFYGNINEKEKECLYNLVKANALNLNANDFTVNYLDDFKEIKNVHIN